jgi:hypothetical protein
VFCYQFGLFAKEISKKTDILYCIIYYLRGDIVMLRGINSYSSLLWRITTQTKFSTSINVNAQPIAANRQYAAIGLSSVTSKAPWQRWIDHNDIPALNRNAPKGTSYEAVPVDEATGRYADTKIPNTKAQLNAFNSLKSIKGQPIGELRAVNNVLKFEAGAYYRYSIGGGQSVIVSSALGPGTSGASIPWEDVAAEFGTDMGVFTPGTGRAFEQIHLFMLALTNGDTYYFHKWFSNSERLELYAQVGIQPGGWVEIQNQNQTTRFYLDSNGIQHSEKQSESARRCMNNKDWRQDGVTADSVFLINGKEYKIDDRGHLNIPAGEPVIYGTTVVFPKEIGEFMRQKSNTSATHFDQQA